MTWKRIDHYPNYEVSDDGRIRSVKNDIILKPETDKDGYLRVTLYRGGSSRRNSKIHILVAIAFLDYRAGYDVNHLDRDKTNNKASNLEVITHKDNMRHWMQDEGLLEAPPF